jgi:PPOX class probable F420-dependent enzyme
MTALSMSKDEREAFLAGAHIGVLAVSRDDGPPSVTPIWYAYEPGGDVVFTTDGGSPKTALLRDAGQATLCAQTETAPYQYVVVEGAVAVSDGVDRAWRRGLGHRYLGPELGDMYADATAENEATAVTVRLTPERWRTVDYGKQFGAV